MTETPFTPTPRASDNDAPRFNPEARGRHRRPRPWNRLSYIARRLPAAVAALVGDLELRPGDRVLDYGCADLPYRHLISPGVEYVAADLAGNPEAVVEIQADGRVPLDDECVDAVLSTQVLEHVSDPQTYLEECARLLRPGGRMLLSTHGIMVYHPDPLDLWRWTCEGLRTAVTDAGLNVVRFEGIMGLGATGIQLTQDALIYRLPRRVRPVFALLAQTTIALIDRFESDENRAKNALVFALVAEKP
jgi:SAM-dependent methyltransferase